MQVLLAFVKFIYELNIMLQKSEIYDENQRLDQLLIDQRRDEDIRREVNHESLLIAKKLARFYNG